MDIRQEWNNKAEWARELYHYYHKRSKNESIMGFNTRRMIQAYKVYKYYTEKFSGCKITHPPRI